jgi:response regulator of citrate/malate metabolism
MLKLKIQDNRYDLMFLDLNLTDGSGFEVLSLVNDTKKRFKCYCSKCLCMLERKKALDQGS